MSKTKQIQNSANKYECCIKLKHELSLIDFQNISKTCRNYAYNGLGIAAQGGWHPLSLENSIELIMKYYPNDLKKLKMAVDMLLSLAIYDSMAFNCDHDTEKNSAYDKYVNGYKNMLCVYNIITSEKMKMYITDKHLIEDCIRINSIYVLLYYSSTFSLNHKSFKGMLKVSYYLSKYLQRYYPFSSNSNYIEACLFASDRESFSTIYCRTLILYHEQLLVLQVTNYKEFAIKHKLKKKLNIAWRFIIKELRIIYKQKQIKLRIDESYKHYGDGYLKLYFPPKISQIILYCVRLYIALKDDEGYGINKFFIYINNKIKRIPKPTGKQYGGFTYLHQQINEQLDTIKKNIGMLTHALLIINDEKKYQIALKYSNYGKEIIHKFKSNRNVMFLKNFLFGRRCEYCLQTTKRLKICKRCKKSFYCSKKCQKRQWITHKQICAFD